MPAHVLPRFAMRKDGGDYTERLQEDSLRVISTRLVPRKARMFSLLSILTVTFRRMGAVYICILAWRPGKAKDSTPRRLHG